MNPNDVVKLCVVYDTGSSSYEAKCVTEYAVYLDILEKIKDVSAEWVELSGKVNDVDSNTLEFVIRRDTIAGIDCCKVNGIE